MASNRVPFVMAAARPAVLRCDGRHVVSGRASFVWETYLMRRAAGVPGEHEIRRGERGSPWHKLAWTIEQAEEALHDWGAFGPRRVERARTTRAARIERGLPVS